MVGWLLKIIVMRFVEWLSDWLSDWANYLSIDCSAPLVVEVDQLSLAVAAGTLTDGRYKWRAGEIYRSVDVGGVFCLCLNKIVDSCFVVSLVELLTGGDGCLNRLYRYVDGRGLRLRRRVWFSSRNTVFFWAGVARQVHPHDMYTAAIKSNPLVYAIRTAQRLR